MKQSVCRICDSKDLKPFFNLGNQPLANALLKKPTAKEKKFPLALTYCLKCSLVQLTFTANKEKLFSNYVWVTNTSETAKQFSIDFFKQLVKRRQTSLGKSVLEIASNDGTFLLPFKKSGYKILGIDPAKNISKIAKKSGIPTIQAFFGSKIATKVLKKEGKFPIIFARNVLPHISNTKDLVKGMKVLLKENGTLAIEVHYAKIIQEQLQYDSIYHEHLCYFTLKNLNILLENEGLYMFDIYKSPISGGSIIIYASNIQKKRTKILNKYFENEILSKTNSLSSWSKFAKKSKIHKEKFLKEIKAASKKGLVVGYGASARSSTLLNFAKVSSSQISAIIDKNEMKQGLFTAGTHIPIVDVESVLTNKPKTIVILAWNFANEITKFLKKDYNYKGLFIIPLPERVFTSNAK